MQCLASCSTVQLLERLGPWTFVAGVWWVSTAPSVQPVMLVTLLYIQPHPLVIEDKFSLAFSGMEMENMTRGHGWRFLDIGRRLEHALHVTRLLSAAAPDLGREEASVLAIVDGRTILMLQAAQDHKRALDGDALRIEDALLRAHEHADARHYCAPVRESHSSNDSPVIFS